MKISRASKKAVKANECVVLDGQELCDSANTCAPQLAQVPAVAAPNNKEEAYNLIMQAIDCLARCGLEDIAAKEGIANLSVVALTLK